MTSSALRKLKKTPALGHSQAPPLDIVRVTSSALRKLKKIPVLGHIHKHPPPLGHCPCDVIHRIRHCILGLQAKKGGSNFGPNVKKPTSWPKRGGGPDPLDPPPPGPATDNLQPIDKFTTPSTLPPNWWFSPVCEL